MAETRIRRHWTPEEKLQIIREARQAGQNVSDVCRRHGIAVGQFYLSKRQPIKVRWTPCATLRACLGIRFMGLGHRRESSA